MTRQLPSLSSGQLSSYYLGFCLFHRLISDRLEGMEGLHRLKLTPPELSPFSTCRNSERGFKSINSFIFVLSLTGWTLNSKLDFQKKKISVAILGYWLVRGGHNIYCESWAVDLWHSSRDLLLKRAGASWVAGPSIESERRSPWQKVKPPLGRGL